jgi:Xaa-Pro aminopeptidase
MTPLELLRQEMAARDIAAVIVPTNDTHFSEYVPQHFKCREWLTGFDGSAGTAVVTQKDAALFADSRYFLQAEQQLYAGFALQKTGMPDSISIADYLLERLSSGVVGVNDALYAPEEYDLLSLELLPLNLQNVGDIFAKIWKQRPPLPDNAAFLLEENFAGASIAQKLQAIHNVLKPAKRSMYIVSALDQTAWLLNLRGGDIRYTPVALAYSVIDWDGGCIYLFVDTKKLSPSCLQNLTSQGVKIEEYAAFEERIAILCKGKTAVYHPQFTSRRVLQIIADNAAAAGTHAPAPLMAEKNGAVPCINALKAVKNETEIAGFRQAMVYDGVAWLRFWYWLEQNVDSGEVTEITAAEKLREFRAVMPNFWDQSFAPIVAYGEHGAIVHYSAAPSTNARIDRRNFVLIDTGAQYYCGTTDITRTLHLGKPTRQQKRDYTLVLKGHIAVQCAMFPQGTRGAQLDALARQYLWRRRLHYMHGTGHGVGHFLGVHEGPQSIRLNENPAPLQAGMVTSCEPGLYRAGEYGIRIENLILTSGGGDSEFGKFLCFEPLTLCPYDYNCIETGLLSAEDKDFINTYHSMVYERIVPYLDEQEKSFLTKKISKIPL